MKHKVVALTLASVVLLAACGGRDFIRPRPDALKPGTTRYEQVIQGFGDPTKVSTTTVNGLPVTTAAYAHAEVGPLGSSFAIRQMVCVFSDGVLVSYDYASSFDADRTPLDDAKVKSLKTGDSKASVRGALGEPTGEAIYPSVSMKGNSVLRYTFLETTKIPFVPKPRETRKVAIVLFDPSDKMLEARIVESKSD